jgi:hypothetical protein
MTSPMSAMRSAYESTQSSLQDDVDEVDAESAVTVIADDAPTVGKGVFIFSTRFEMTSKLGLPRPVTASLRT